MTEPNGPLEETIIVGLGELRATSAGNAILVCLGLGSCVALCGYDPVSRVAGMAHMVLPSSNGKTPSQSAPKFVDCATPMLIEEMVERGAVQSRIGAKLVGGARVIKTDKENHSLDIARQNVQAAIVVLERLGVPLQAAETGGNKGRTVKLHAGSGRLLVSTLGGSEREL